MEYLHSRTLGEGKPLLILHGFLGMSDNWRTLGKQFSKEGYQVHLIDQRNHGKSFHAPDFNYELLSADVVSYLKYHQLDAVYLLGHSMGGKTAMHLATSYPEYVARLMVADIAPKYYPPHHQNLIDALAKLDFDRISSRKEADAILARDVVNTSTRQFLLKNLYWVQPGKLGFRFNFEVLQHSLDAVGQSLSTTAHYEGPTLFLRGDQSGYITPQDVPEIQKHFPNAQVATIDHAGHWLHAENPKQFFEKVLYFLRS